MSTAPQTLEKKLYEKDTFYPNGWWRLGAHLLLWLVLFLFIFAQYEWVNQSSTTGGSAVLWLTVGNLSLMCMIFYWVANYVLPQIYQKQWLILLINVLFVYVINSFGNYFIFVETDRLLGTSSGIHRVAEIYRNTGLIGGLVSRTVFVLNWSFMLNTIIPISIKFMKDVLATRNQTTQLERDNLILELNFLRSQVNPHFFFNAINNVYALIVDKDEQASTILLKLSSLMRYVLYEAGTAYVTLQQEIDFLKDYVDLEKIRHGDSASILLQIEGDAENLLIPPLVLITFVENAFKHGINATIRESWVTIDLRIKDNSLNFLIRNSKPAVRQQARSSSLPKVGGIGLTNTQRRLELLYPDRHQLQIQQTPITYTVDLTLLLDGTRTNMPYRG
ncbi:sensor histidine kinase [Spirosoma oryzicola]|uniref:sensor histidine kinase n=1 Tax=Spirosoma oryzicola TaxID=2898794 RepID=UPI001E51A211|nr:histidine kinase [Spirosoma oryzicola]UHG94926.1 histidine kinase [Spirosoma oryzicola]